MSNVVGDGRFPHDFMTTAKELNRETFNEVVIPFLIRHHVSRMMFTDAVKTVLDKLKINIVGKGKLEFETISNFQFISSISLLILNLES